MESPTVEISRGLEALRLEGLLKLSTSSAAVQQTSTTSREREKSGSIPQSTSSTVRASQSQPGELTCAHRLQQCGSLPTTRSTPTLRDPLPTHACPYHSRETQLSAHVQHSLTFLNPSCPYCVRDMSQRTESSSNSFRIANGEPAKNSDGAGITESFSGLSVSGHVTGVASVPRSCREEAGAASHVNCLDDTTVDDLAGYLDEIMFIPKPMSEMAELMYT